VVNSPLTFNGVNVGNYQYINGFMRAEFWNATSVSKNLSDPISWSFAPAQTFAPFPPGFGIVVGTGCSELGVISSNVLNLFLTGLIPALQAGGVISPTKFAVFLLKNVVGSGTPPTFPKNCCTGGYHGAIGSPAQTYGVMEYDTTGQFGGVHDVTVPSHEIGEWMNDPLGNNPTPAFGHIGQVSGCQTNLEVGDPLSQVDMPVITLSGYAYHVQELAFFDWFFNAKTVPSFGTGGEFSGNGTFEGPSKPCPPGGTY
jgi:hypothetical protein